MREPMTTSPSRSAPRNSWPACAPCCGGRGCQRPTTSRPWLRGMGSLSICCTVASGGAAHRFGSRRGSVSGGRPLGLALTFAGFLLIDYFFQVPYGTLSVSKPLDWIVLLAFLTTAVVTTQLLTQERARAAEAERRAGEVASLGRLGAEILSAGRAEDSLAGIAELI